MKGRMLMQQEQMSPLDTPQGTSPEPVDVFMDRLVLCKIKVSHPGGIFTSEKCAS
jgi:hypothetical protein